jgi:hypothetical protein
VTSIQVSTNKSLRQPDRFTVIFGEPTVAQLVLTKFAVPGAAAVAALSIVPKLTIGSGTSVNEQFTLLTASS